VTRGEWLAIEGDLATVRTQASSENVHERALAAPFSPTTACTRGLGLEHDTVQGASRTEGLLDAADEQRAGGDIRRATPEPVLQIRWMRRAISGESMFCLLKNVARYRCASRRADA